ncbi:MAG: hypothetical protein KF760_00495 [Candidatus Eremiobacteraeota bacterium]|nr:hypothetical protein [Candidatus Eremiobacteraeota bacterium]
MLLVLALMTLPAIAGRELNNRSGTYNGDYVAMSIAIREPDKEEVKKEKVNIALRERYVDILWSPDKADRCRVDFIYTTGYKTEISARAAEGDTRFFIIIDGTIGPSQ